MTAADLQTDSLNDLEDTLLERVLDWFEQDDRDGLQAFATDAHPGDIGAILESLPPEPRRRLWELIPPERDGDILVELPSSVRETLIRDMNLQELNAAAEHMAVSDLAEVIDELPEDIGSAFVESLDDDIRDRLQHSLTFDEDTAGRLMDEDVVTVRADVTLSVVHRFLKMRKSLPLNTDGLMVVDREDCYQGKVSLESLLTQDSELTVAEVMSTSDDRINASMSSADVADLFERHDLVSAAVVDDEGRLLGRIIIDDVVDIIRARADEALLHMAGLSEEEDLFAPPLISAWRRAIWLGINLITAFLAAWVIGRFEGALSQIVALAVLMPVVASMGGIAGSQTLTLTIRGLALKQIEQGNVFWLTRKEVIIGLLNGVVWALVVGLVAILWFHDLGIGAVIAVAILVNLLAAAVAGIAIPLILDRFGIDPALSGAVILTTVTDVVGFISFLGLATMFLL